MAKAPSGDRAKAPSGDWGGERHSLREEGG